MNRLFTLVLGCLVAAYPLVVVLGLQVMPVYYLGIFFIVLAILRLWLFHSSKRWQALPLLLSVILILVALYAMFSGQPMWFRFYPVAVNGIFFGFFFVSLWRGPPVAEQFARTLDPNFSDLAMPYTRKVTVLWCIFFVGNGVAALYTAMRCSFEVWAWYNGLLAYALMGALFACEWLVRKRVQRKLNV